MRLCRPLLVGLLLPGLAVVAGCDSQSEATSHQAFGKQFEIAPTRKRKSSLLDRTDEVQPVSETSAGIDPNAAAPTTGFGRSAGILTFGATGGAITDSKWSIEDDSYVVSSSRDHTKFDLRLLDTGSVETEYKAHFERGDELLKRGDIEAALHCFEDAKAINPKNHPAYVGEAFCYYQRKEFGRALAAIDFALRYAPTLTALYGHRGNIRAQLNDFNGAVEDFSRLIKENPADVGALSVRAQFYTRLGKHQAAVGDYTTALAEAPNEPLLWISRAVSYFKLNKFKEAEADATEALKRRDNLIDGYYLRSIARLNMRQFEKARDDYDAAVRLGLDERIAAQWRPVFYPGEATPKPAAKSTQP